MILWSVWWNRNLIIQKNEPKTATVLVNWALEFLSEFQGTHQALSATISQLGIPHKSCWCPPPVNTFKLNSDASIRDGFHFIGLGAVIRNHKGEIVAALSKPLQGSFDVVLGEFLALREGLLLAKRLNITLKLAEVDAIAVANDVNNSEIVNCNASFIVSDIKALLQEVGGCVCNAISRTGNTLAHVLASMAFSFKKEQFWLKAI